MWCVSDCNNKDDDSKRWVGLGEVENKEQMTIWRVTSEAVNKGSYWFWICKKEKLIKVWNNWFQLNDCE